MKIILIKCVLNVLFLSSTVKNLATFATTYSTGNSKFSGNNDNQIKGERYISSLWKSAVDRPKQNGDNRHGTMLTPNGNSQGPTIIQIVPKLDGKQQLSILSSGGGEEELFDLASKSGKIFNIPNSGNGPLQILKSPGSLASLLVKRRGKHAFNLPNKKQKKGKFGNGAIDNSQDSSSRTTYIGSVTSILAETLCPLCRRLRDQRYRVACLLRYCYENPNLSSAGNPT